MVTGKVNRSSFLRNGGAVAIVALFLMAEMLPSSEASRCTPATCVGPVVVEFDNADCSGTPTYSDNGLEEGCFNGDLRQYTDTAMVFWTINNDECDYTLPNATYNTYSFQYGVCGQPELKKRDNDLSDAYDVALSMFGLTRRGFSERDGASQGAASYGVIFLPHVNASYTAPQPSFRYSDTIPDLESAVAPVECYGIENCTLPSGGAATYYETVYSASSCNGPVLSRMYPELHYDGHACYNLLNNTYISYRCTGEHSYQSAYHFGSSCTDPPAILRDFRSVCSSQTVLTYTCLTPLYTEPPTPSAASSLRPLIALFCLLASLVFLV
jgi:hypothetical protein